MNFFKINGRAITSPTNIGHSVEILDKVERTMDGTMVVDEIGIKNIIDVSWEYLKKDDMIILKEEITKSGFTTITYQDSDTGTSKTINAKAKDIHYNTGYDWVKQIVLWKSVQVTFEEK